VPYPRGLLTLGQLLASLVVIYIASKIGGELALRFKQPEVLGELVAGLVVGSQAWPSQPRAAGTSSASQVGVILLLFEVGLESGAFSRSVLKL